MSARARALKRAARARMGAAEREAERVWSQANAQATGRWSNPYVRVVGRDDSGFIHDPRAYERACEFARWYRSKGGIGDAFMRKHARAVVARHGNGWNPGGGGLSSSPNTTRDNWRAVAASPKRLHPMHPDYKEE